MAKTAFLIIGDKKVNLIRVNRSLRKFVRYARKLKEMLGLKLEVVDYGQLLCGQVPRIAEPTIKIAFFFPYQYWNQHIEVYRDGKIYGEQSFGRQFRAYFRRVERAIKKYYPQKRVVYLNSPRSCALDRDKQATKDRLRRKHIPVPRSFRPVEFNDLQRLVNRGLSLYLKPRFGAMGKGITYINREGVISNFIFRKGKIISRPSDYNWKFVRIREERKFLNKLLKKGFICEQAIAPATFRRRRYDFRVYVIFNQVVYLYAKSSPDQYWVTNWSQGGKIDKQKKILATVPKEKIRQIKKLAKRTARSLNLNFAGIDVIFSQGLTQAFVLEANAFPGFEKGFDLMKCLLQYLVK